MPSPFQTLLEAARDRTLPPVERWHPRNVGEIDIRIAANGDWYHDGDPIRRPAIAKLFSTILRLDDGQHYLVTPAEKLRIRVDDAPFIATDMETEAEGGERRILFTTNMDDVVVADAEHPILVEDRDGEPRPYVVVRRGLRALIARSVFYRLVDLACEDSDGAFSVHSAGTRFILGRAWTNRAASTGTSDSVGAVGAALVGRPCWPMHRHRGCRFPATPHDHEDGRGASPAPTALRTKRRRITTDCSLHIHAPAPGVETRINKSARD